jgi:hypothetical protein
MVEARMHGHAPLVCPALALPVIGRVIVPASLHPGAIVEPARARVVLAHLELELCVDTPGSVCVAQNMSVHPIPLRV